MADEAASLLVRITGDASQLEATISGVARSLQSLEKGGSGVSGNTQKAIDKVSKSTRSYADVVAGAKQQLDAKNTTLKKAKTEYEDTKKAVDGNIKSLNSERDAVSKVIKTRQSEIDNLKDANTVVGKNSQTYKDNKKAIEWTEAELKEANKQYKDLTKQIDAQNARLRNSEDSYKTARDEADKAGAQYQTLSKNMAEVTRQEKALKIQDAGDKIKNFGEGVDDATKPLQTLAVATAAGGVAAAKFAIDFEDNFSAVKKTVEGTPEQLETIRQGIIDLTTIGLDGRNPLPMTTAELTELAAAGGQLGIQTENILDFTEVMAQMGTATNLAGEEGAQQMARFMNVMGESQGNIRNVGSAVVDLGNNFETTEAEIIQMANRMGKYGNTVGMSTADVLGFSTALSSLGIEAEMGGSAIGRTWLSIETAVASGGEELEAFAKYSNKSAEQFAKDWDTNASGAFMDLLKGLSEADNLTLALSDLGISNTLDIQAMMAMANGIDLVSEALGRSKQAYAENTALQEEFDKKAETTKSKIIVTIGNIVEAARGIGETMLPTITDMSTGVAEFAQKLAGLDEGTQKTIVGIGAAIVGIGAGAKGVASVSETFGTLITTFGKAKSALPALSAIAPALIPIAGAAAGVTAVAVGLEALNSAAEEAEQKRIHFAVDTEISADNVEAAVADLNEMKALAQEFETLQFKINAGELQGAELDAAQSRLEEIAAWFEQEYNVKLEVDDNDVVTAANNVEKLDNAINKQSGKVDQEQSDLYDDIREAAGDYRTSGSRKEEYTAKGERFQGLYSQYSEVVDVLEDWSAEYDTIKEKSYSSTKDQKRDIKQLAEEYRGIIKDKGLDGLVSLWGDNFESELEDARTNMNGYSTLAKEAETNAQGIADSAKKQEEGMRTFLSTELDRVKDLAQSGEDYTQRLERIKNVAEILGENDFNNNQSTLMNTAIAAAEAQNGLEGFTQAAQTSNEAVQALTNDALKNLTDWGVDSGKSVNTLTETMTQAGISAQESAGYIYSALSQSGVSAEESASLLTTALSNIGVSAQDTGMYLSEIFTNAGMSAQQAAETINAAFAENGVNDIEMRVNAEGNLEAVDKLQAAVDKINETGNVELQIDANGDLSLLDTADEKLKEMSKNQTLTVELNAEGDFEVFDEVDNKIAEIDGKTGTVTFTADTSEPDEYQPEDKEGTANYTMGDQPTDGDLPSLSGTANYTMGEHPTDAPDVPGTANYSMGDHPTKAPDIHGTAYYTVSIIGDIVDSVGSSGSSIYIEATGTKDFPGGLAMVNDQKNVADPRELIVDHGRAFIPHGKNVILPLSKGAKVYTATQTKQIAKRLGIPGFADGLNNDSNSDAFTAAQDDLTHYLNTHAVSVTQELEKWVELSGQFTDNIKDAEDIEEEIYRLTRERNEELNDESMKYIELRTEMNDWADIGDDPISAYERIRDRNWAELEAERLTWEEYSDIMAEAGNALYEGRLDQSYDWLEHQREYNDMSIDDYIAGLNRMASYTTDYYEQGLIDHQTYRENMTAIDEDYLDAVKEKNEEIRDAYFESADNYKTIRDTYDDWDEVGDSEVRYYTARLANIERLKREEVIGWQEYMDLSRENYLDLYKAVEDAQQEQLDEFRDYIDSEEQRMRDEEQALRDSWDVEDRETDLDEVNRLLGIYENAATDQGRKKYKDLLEQKKELEREEQLYRLEQDNNARLAELEEEYDRMEAEKANVLKSLRTETFNIFGEAENINVNTSDMLELAGLAADAASNSAAEQTNVLYQILNALQGLRINQTTYQDGRQITISRGLTESAAERLINGTIVTGMGTVILSN